MQIKAILKETWHLLHYCVLNKGLEYYGTAIGFSRCCLKWAKSWDFLKKTITETPIPHWENNSKRYLTAGYMKNNLLWFPLGRSRKLVIQTIKEMRRFLPRWAVRLTFQLLLALTVTIFLLFFSSYPGVLFRGYGLYQAIWDHSLLPDP